MEKEKTLRSSNGSPNIKQIIKDFASYIREARINSGMSQRDIANELGHITPQFISNWERAVSIPPAKDIPILAKHYKLSEKSMAKKLFDVEMARAEIAVIEKYEMYLGRKWQ